MKTQPINLRTGERRESSRPIYVYIIEHGTDLFHFTGLDEELSITGLPASHGTDPQTFVPAQISHGAVDQRSEINAPNITVQIGLQENALAEELKALILTAVPLKTTVIVARMNPDSIAALDWTADNYVIFKGRVTSLTFNRFAIQLQLVSLLMQNDGKVPRYFWQKSCQHMLYGDRCGVNSELANNKLSTTIASVSARARFVDIADTTINGNTITNKTFQGGKVTIGTETISIVSSTLLGGGGGTRLFLAWWSTALVASASIAVYRGCLRTVSDCDTIFSNLANFGGFPYIPDVNPTVNGIRTGKNN
jgi:hypothetical protein